MFAVEFCEPQLSHMDANAAGFSFAFVAGRGDTPAAVQVE
jgi:hypothetical protein